MENKKGVQCIEFKFKSVCLRKQTLETQMETHLRGIWLKSNEQGYPSNSPKKWVKSLLLKNECTKPHFISAHPLI